MRTSASDGTAKSGIYSKALDDDDDDALHHLQSHSFGLKQKLYLVFYLEHKTNLPSSQVQQTQNAQSNQLPTMGLELANERL